MATFDSTKSLILDISASQSNMTDKGRWTDSSTTGIYAPYEALKSTDIDSKLLCREFKIKGLLWNSDRTGDFYEVTSGFNSHSLPSALGINMTYSFVIDLMTYLNSIGFTKNVWLLNFGLGGTSMRVTPSTFDWGTPLELTDEANMQLMDIIKYEKDVNGNNSQVINLRHQGEADQAFYATYKDEVLAFYEKKKKVLGSDFKMFVGQLVPSSADRISMNTVLFELDDENEHIHVIGRSLAGGVNTWEKMEADDPDGIIDASLPTTYTYAADLTHYNWSAQILQGRQLFDLVMEKYFGI